MINLYKQGKNTWQIGIILDISKSTISRYINNQENKDEIKTAERTIEGICGVKTTLFAPPSGSFSESTIKACDELGYKVIMWSKDTIDWRDKDVDLIFKRATQKSSLYAF